MHQVSVSKKTPRLIVMELKSNLLFLCVNKAKRDFPFHWVENNDMAEREEASIPRNKYTLRKMRDNFVSLNDVLFNRFISFSD